MNIKAAYRYQMADNIKAIIIYYIILSSIFLLILSGFGIVISSNDETVVSGQFGGIEIATIIFVFVAGIDGFKDTFGMLMQNGVSRKSLFISHLFAALTIALLMATVDKILLLIFKVISKVVDSIYCTSLFEQTYTKNTAGIGSFELHFTSFLFDFLLYLSFFAIGYLIRLIYYKMDKLGAIILSVTVPVGFLIVLPFFDLQVAKGKLSSFLADLADTAFGISANYPVNAMITCALLFILFSCFSWLLMRRATIKD